MALAAKKAARRTFHVLDQRIADDIAGQKIAADRTVKLTDAEARWFIDQGAIADAAPQAPATAMEASAPPYPEAEETEARGRRRR